MAESPNLSVLTCALHYISVGESLIPYCEGKWRISAGGEDATEVWTKSNIVEFIITPATTTKDTLACNSHMHANYRSDSIPLGCR